MREGDDAVATGLRIIATAACALTGAIAFAGAAHADGPVNLRVDDAVRADLLTAGAALKAMPTSDFTGLEPGATYYAFDPGTGTHWAAGHLLPSANYYEAQVADQDAGGFTLFEQLPGQGWTAFDDGYPRGVGACPAPLPETIVTLWKWDPTQCRPDGH